MKDLLEGNDDSNKHKERKYEYPNQIEPTTELHYLLDRKDEGSQQETEYDCSNKEDQVLYDEYQEHKYKEEEHQYDLEQCNKDASEFLATQLDATATIANRLNGCIIDRHSRTTISYDVSILIVLTVMLRRPIRTTDVAKLIVAAAGHMVAPLILLNYNLAFFALPIVQLLLKKH